MFQIDGAACSDQVKFSEKIKVDQVKFSFKNRLPDCHFVELKLFIPVCTLFKGNFILKRCLCYRAPNVVNFIYQLYLLINNENY